MLDERINRGTAACEANTLLTELPRMFVFFFIAINYANQLLSYANKYIGRSAHPCKLITAELFATYIVQYLFFLNPKFNVSS